MNHHLDYILHLADNAVILGQRNSEWCGHGPVLEQDIAITNISLDLIGQARTLYQYAAQLMGNGATEDSLAFRRDVREFKNCLLAEQPGGDWAHTILRQFFFSNYQYCLCQRLLESTHEPLRAIAEKSLKEVTYHLRWSSEWVIRLGDGTGESHHRMKNAIEQLWPFTGELFIPASYENVESTGCTAVDDKQQWMARVRDVFDEAMLTTPAEGWMQSGGKEGNHSEHLGYILAEMQFLQRAYPEATW